MATDHVDKVSPSDVHELPVLSGLVNVEMHINGTRLAQAFWELPSREQAAFFNHLGSHGVLPYQLHEVAKNPALTAHGRVAMQNIGEYSNES
jgi:hypothetical protein